MKILFLIMSFVATIALYTCGKTHKTFEQVPVLELEVGKGELSLGQPSVMDFPEDEKLVPNLPNANNMNYIPNDFYLGKNIYIPKANSDILVGLKNGVLNFVNRKDPLSSSIIPSCSSTLGGVYFRLQDTSSENLNATKSFSINLINLAHNYPTNHFYTGGGFFEDKNGRLFLLTKLYEVKSTPDSRVGVKYKLFYKNIVALFLVELIEGQQEAKLKKVFEYSGQPVAQNIVGDNFIFLSQTSGEMQIDKYSLDSSLLVKSVKIHIHTDKTDSFSRIVEGNGGRFFIFGKWKSGANEGMELMKLDSDLNPITEVVTDNSNSGLDGMIDVFSHGTIVQRGFLDILMMDEHVVLAGNVIGATGAKANLFKVNRTTGELDKNFQSTGIVSLPSTNEMRLTQHENKVIVASIVGGGIRVRAIDENGRSAKINGDDFFEIPFGQSMDNFLIKRVVSKDNSLKIFGFYKNNTGLYQTKILSMDIK